ncbi:MAG TPA: transglutaminase family protein [Gemmataceae bacterium]|nr:transglutaminase family protein [Gemmataceae bacterium]
MQYQVTHTTTYQYSKPVSLCQNLAHLTPRDVPEQHCLRTALSIAPQPAVLSERIDYFGNSSTFFTVQEPHRELVVTASHLIQLSPRPAPDPSASVPWEEVRDLLPADRGPATLEAYQFVFASRYTPAGPDLAAYALASFPTGRPLLEGVLDLTGRIHRDFVYDPRATTVATPLKEVFAKRRGVCQDFAHLQLACLRVLGLAARYVSGYLSTSPPPGQPRLLGADATHAWLSAWCPRLGWVDVDPTNDLVPADKHILLAWGRDYDDVSPIKGVILGGGQHVVRVAVDVTRLDSADTGE